LTPMTGAHSVHASRPLRDSVMFSLVQNERSWFQKPVTMRAHALGDREVRLRLQLCSAPYTVKETSIELTDGHRCGWSNVYWRLAVEQHEVKPHINDGLLVDGDREEYLSLI
jgi:hypothetical protein